MTSAGSGSANHDRRPGSRGNRLVLGPWPEGPRRPFRFIDWIMELPEALEGRFWDEFTTCQRDHQMPFIDIPQRKEIERAKAERPRRPAGAILPEE